MKLSILRIVIAALLLMSLLPLDGFCCDHPDESAHDCVVVCNAVCHSAVTLNQPTQIIFSSVVNSFVVNEPFFYQNPSLDTLKRPPVVSA